MRYEPHWNAQMTRVTWEAIDEPEIIDPGIPATNEAPAMPNRAERRRLTRDIVRKARREARKAERRQNQAIRELRGKRCPRCNLLFIGRAQWRCQCKVIPKRYEGLEQQMQAMRESEEASAAEAQRRLYEQREWDDEQHRQAKENGANVTA